GNELEVGKVLVGGVLAGVECEGVAAGGRSGAGIAGGDDFADGVGAGREAGGGVGAVGSGGGWGFAGVERTVVVGIEINGDAAEGGVVGSEAVAGEVEGFAAADGDELQVGEVLARGVLAGVECEGVAAAGRRGADVSGGDHLADGVGAG